MFESYTSLTSAVNTSVVFKGKISSRHSPCGCLMEAPSLRPFDTSPVCEQRILASLTEGLICV